MDNNKLKPQSVRQKSVKKGVKHPPSNKKVPVKTGKHQMNLSGLSSPKTIDYSKVMEKYGNIIEGETPRKTYSSSKKRLNNKDILENYKTHSNFTKKLRPKSAINDNYNNTTNNFDLEDISTYSNFTNTKRTNTNRNNTLSNNYNIYDRVNSEMLTLQHKLETAEAKISLLEEEKKRNYYSNNIIQRNNISSNNGIDKTQLTTLIQQIEILKK